MRISLVGTSGNTELKSCYLRALKADEHQVQDLAQDVFLRKEQKWGKLGKALARVKSPQSWGHHANRKLMLELLDFEPELILLFGNLPVSLGVLAYVKSRLPNSPIFLVWPDTLFNFRADSSAAAGLLDGVATYGEHTMDAFKRLGFKQVHWIALGADEFIHKSKNTSSDFRFDLSFVGGWRPERQSALEAIVRELPDLKLKVHGPNWRKICEGSVLEPHCSNDPIYGEPYAELCHQSRICLNVIDDTNYPAANMRFFELPMARALQLCSPCPEMESTFRHREHMLYFTGEKDLVLQVRWAIENEQQLAVIRRAGHDLALQEHSYRVRARALLAAIKNSESVL